MVLFENRKKIQLLRGTNAERLLHVLLEGEVWIVDDGAGNPTGAVFVGDGATSGGLDLIKVLGSGLTVTGAASLMSPTLVAALLTLTGNVQMAKSTPQIVVVNTDQEDGDGGRETTMLIGGERSGGETVTSAMIIAAHDGSADDDRGRLDVYVNDGDDGLIPSVRALRLAPELATFATEVVGPVGRLAEVYNASSHGFLNSLGAQPVQFDTSAVLETGFSLATYEVTVDFDGRVEAQFHAGGAWLSGGSGRLSSLFTLEHKPAAGSYSAVPAAFNRAYHRSTTNAGGCSIVPRTVSVGAGDSFRVTAHAEQGGTSFTIPVQGACLKLRRLGPAS